MDPNKKDMYQKDVGQKIQTQIRIKTDVKKEATELFEELGLDMSTAVNLFLKQCILCRGLPFNVGMPGSRTNRPIGQHHGLNNHNRDRDRRENSRFEDSDIEKMSLSEEE